MNPYCPDCTDGFQAVTNKHGEVIGETACFRCRPEDAALVDACEALRDKARHVRYDHGKWRGVA